MDHVMPRYTAERKASVLQKLLPPHNASVPEIAAAEGISEATLYNWLKQTREQGIAVPGSRPESPEHWSGQAKFAAVLETAGMNESERSEYCRRKGLYPEQLDRWKASCIAGADQAEATDAPALKQARKQVRALEKELRRKEKALAESAALLVLQKKFHALWEDEEK